MELEVYSQSINRGVVKMPSQSFPGLILQGETLSTLMKLAQTVQEKSQKTLDPALIEAALELRDSLQKLLSHYEATLGKHNIPLPYSTIQPKLDGAQG
ncbi:MAG TPA: hypothetical protein VN653_02175 [Anaerolineales bacterium]|nr:hypothetical protein [Anaerolineales bacterium]